MAEKKAYTQAAGTGKYDKSTGLFGKYDNVRRFWEDQVTWYFIRQPLNELVEDKRRRLERLRILDIGCGSGDGYDLITGVTTKDPGLYDHITSAITPDMLREYVGMDINDELLKQAEEYYGGDPKINFVQGDLSAGLPEVITEDGPFDIYSTTYGTLSHFGEEQTVDIVADVCKHAPERAIFIGDWLGRYSYEWQDLWHHPVDEEYFMDYRITYIYPEEERDSVEVESFPLRLMTQQEIMRIIKAASEKSGIEIRPLTFFDRSILIGRHMDTGDYNANCPKLRAPINSLFEGYERTDLESLLIDHVPRRGFDGQNKFFDDFFMACNALVKFTIELLSAYDSSEKELTSVPPIYEHYPEQLKKAMDGMKRIVESMGWCKWGDVRANVIEPQLGYTLRQLEMKMQPGTGFGHSLVGVFEIRK